MKTRAIAKGSGTRGQDTVAHGSQSDLTQADYENGENREPPPDILRKPGQNDE